MTGMAQAVVSPQTSPDFKKWIIEVSKKTEKLMEKILQDMDMMNPEDAVMSLDDVINTQQAMQMPMQPPSQMPPGGSQMPPAGQPGMM